MRAVRVHEFGNPDVLVLDQLDGPRPRAGEVLIEIHAAGVNPVDTYVRSGAYERLPPLPYIPCGDGAGIIREVGDGVSRFRPGDRVYIAGATEKSLTGCAAGLAVKKQSHVHPLPDRITFEQGAAIGVPYATAFRALVDKGEAQAGETVLVHGASGGVGTAAVQLAVARGMRVAGTASRRDGQEWVRQCGAERVLDHSKPGYLEDAKDWTDGRGFDVILEMAAHQNLDADLDAAAQNGRIVIVGCRDSVCIRPRLALVKDLTIRGLSLANTPLDRMGRLHAELVSGLESGALNPLVGPVFPFSLAAEAHRAIEGPDRIFGKIVLTP